MISLGGGSDPGGSEVRRSSDPRGSGGLPGREGSDSRGSRGFGTPWKPPVSNPSPGIPAVARLSVLRDVNRSLLGVPFGVTRVRVPPYLDLFGPLFGPLSDPFWAGGVLW